MIMPYIDCARFINTITHRSKPEWMSVNEKVYEDNAVILRKFDKNRPGVPILIVPPQAGHHSSIADYAPGCSLVQACLENTDKPVYAIEWKPSTPARSNESIDDLVRQLMVCVKKIRGRIVLVGLCQGGWLSTIYTALFGEDVAALVLAAAPIDFTAGGGKLQDLVQQLPMEYYRGLVRCGSGNMSGDLMLMGWKMMNPYDRFVGDFVNIWLNVRDERYLERTRKFQEWYEHTQDISGQWYLEAVEALFKENKLIKGRLKVLGEVVDLGRITCPLALLAGERDDITLPEQVYNLARYASTPKEQVFQAVIPQAGHISVFMGRRALQHEWPEALNFISGRLGWGRTCGSVEATC
ncbi:MAG: alpha/beta fold hydrolase [Deltaproteobacteria bacterium]|nr:alpha/beta fold hydrolase [Deltaproteobacteria bacterium]